MNSSTNQAGEPVGSRHGFARQAIRALLMTATREQLEAERDLSLERGDRFRAACVQELINEG
jgi:hypothetical protein